MHFFQFIHKLSYMYNLFKKEEVINGVEIPQLKDWTKDLKRNQLVEQEAEQMS